MSLKPLSIVAFAAHWAACCFGAAVVVTFAVFAVSQRLPLFASMNASFLAVGVMLAGFLLMWWKDWLGGAISLVGLGWFQAAEIALNGQPTRGLLPLFLAPGVLGLLAGLIRRFAQQPAR